jgi:hypothetical protein
MRARSALERRERFASARGQQQEASARVVRAASPLDQPSRLEPAQQARQIAGVEQEVARQLARRARRPLGDFVEQAGLGQRPRAAEHAVVQQAEPLRVEAVVPADRGDRVAFDRLVQSRVGGHEDGKTAETLYRYSWWADSLTQATIPPGRRSHRGGQASCPGARRPHMLDRAAEMVHCKTVSARLRCFVPRYAG